MTSLTRAETILMQEYLEGCGEQFGGRPCNDFFMPHSADNLAVFQAACRAHGDGQDNVLAGDLVFIPIDHLLGYLGQRCKTVLGTSGEEASLSGAELHVMAEALQHAYQVFDDLSHEASFGATLPATADNKAMISAALRDVSPVLGRCTDTLARNSAMKAFKTAAEGIRSARGDADTVDVPTHWLIYYFSRQCAQLSETLVRTGERWMLAPCA